MEDAERPGISGREEVERGRDAGAYCEEVAVGEEGVLILGGS